MIAVMIFFVVVGALLNLSSNSKHLLQLSQQLNRFKIESSVPLIEAKKTRNLYEQLIEFNITNDKIINALKHRHVKIETKIDVVSKLEISPGYLVTQKIVKRRVFDREFANDAYKVDLE